jgi:hypothetical protein
MDIVVSMLVITYSAEIYKEITFHALTAQIWVLPFLIWLVVANVAQTNKWVVWAAITWPLSYPSRK